VNNRKGINKKYSSSNLAREDYDYSSSNNNYGDDQVMDCFPEPYHEEDSAVLPANEVTNTTGDVASVIAVSKSSGSGPGSAISSGSSLPRAATTTTTGTSALNPNPSTSIVRELTSSDRALGSTVVSVASTSPRVRAVVESKLGSSGSAKNQQQVQQQVQAQVQAQRQENEAAASVFDRKEVVFATSRYLAALLQHWLVCLVRVQDIYCRSSRQVCFQI
jgi:hypothetical protein